MKNLALLAALAVPMFLASAAHAGCRIHNETKHKWTIRSGNTSNQRVGSHTTTSIAAGRIIAKSDDGKTVGGSCKDGDKIKIISERGVPVLVIK